MAETENAVVADDRTCWLIYVNDFGRATARKVFAEAGDEKPSLDETLRARKICDPIRLEGSLRDASFDELRHRFPPPKIDL